MRTRSSAAIAGLLLCAAAVTNGAELEHRWVYVSHNLLVDANVKTVIDIMRRAKEAGYNGVVLADYKFNIHVAEQVGRS